MVKFFAVGLACFLSLPVIAQPLQGDTPRGEAIYNSRCIACHSPDANRVGPKHRDVVGRKAGSVPDYAYSDALKDAGFVWNEEKLNKWLSDPQSLVPGAKMPFKVNDPKDRADIIAYLKSISGSNAGKKSVVP